MKIALVGKGGSGKTTLAALLVRRLAAVGCPVLAVDADINQHLAVALGATQAQAAALPTLAEHLPLIKDYLRGVNPRIASAEVMVKTTPPGAVHGWCASWTATRSTRLVCATSVGCGWR